MNSIVARAKPISLEDGQRAQAQCGVCVATIGNGATMRAWLEPVNDPGCTHGVLWARAFDVGGEPYADAFEVSSGTVAGTGLLIGAALAIATLSAGGFVIAWTGHGASDAACVCVQSFDDHGARRGAVRRINSNPLQGRTEILLTALPSSGFVVAWRDRVDPSPHAAALEFHTRMFDRFGESLGNEFLCTFRA